MFIYSIRFLRKIAWMLLVVFFNIMLNRRDIDVIFLRQLSPCFLGRSIFFRYFLTQLVK